MKEMLAQIRDFRIGGRIINVRFANNFAIIAKNMRGTTSYGEHKNRNKKGKLTKKIKKSLDESYK